VAEIEEQIHRRSEITSERAEVEKRTGTARTLAVDLQADHFVAYLLEEALEALAADAGHHLRAFPSASFSLAVDGRDFSIIDHANADERRSVKTLSGGESFAASLALAIAFAETLAKLAGGDGPSAALESLFLDEGFGTLDAEHLDAVAGAIEALYGRERTVGIITHIPELAERLPARIVVSKTGNSSQVRIEMS
jgi:exonuclease SbcC